MKSPIEQGIDLVKEYVDLHMKIDQMARERTELNLRIMDAQGRLDAITGLVGPLFPNAHNIVQVSQGQFAHVQIIPSPSGAYARISPAQMFKLGRRDPGEPGEPGEIRYVHGSNDNMDEPMQVEVDGD